MSTALIVYLIILIYASFILDFLIFPIPSEASTAAILGRAEYRHSSTYLLLRLAHLALLVLWLYPLVHAISAWFKLTQVYPFWPAIMGIGVAIVGRTITLLASSTLRKATSGELIDYGIFSISRHPIVVGLHLTLMGLLLTTAKITPLLLFPATLVYFNKKVLIEEQALLQRFNQEYQRYSNKTPRYLGLLSRVKPSRPKGS